MCSSRIRFAFSLVLAISLKKVLKLSFVGDFFSSWGQILLEKGEEGLVLSRVFGDVELIN